MRPIILAVITAASVLGQTVPMPQTILAQPITNITGNQIVLGSIGNAHPPGVQFPLGGLDFPSGGISPNTVMTAWPPPEEAFRIYQVGAAGLTNRVFANRGMYGTYPHMWPQGTLMWIGPAKYFANNNPSGNCNPFAALALPQITIPSGTVWNCPIVGLTWQFATFQWFAGYPRGTSLSNTTWSAMSTLGQSHWQAGITWDEDGGWWDATPAAWNSI